MKCISNTQDGPACRARAQAGSEFCYFHDPATTLERREAQSKGGSKQSHLKVMPTPPPDCGLDDPRKIPKLLNFLANGILRGDIDTKDANSIGYLADCAMRAHKAGELAERLEQMELLQGVELATPMSSPTRTTILFDDEHTPAVEVVKDVPTIEVVENGPTIEVVKDGPTVELVEDEPTPEIFRPRNRDLMKK